MNQQLETPQGLVTIRSVRESDAESYRDIRIEALRTVPIAFGSDVASAEARTIEQWRQQMRGGAGDGETLNLVAEAAGELVAITVFQQESGSKLKHNGNIYSVYVRTPWRGQGVFDALFAAGLAWAEPRGVRVLKLSVSAVNTPAIRLYTKLGFQIYGVDPEPILWEGRYYDELLMYRRV